MPPIDVNGVALTAIFTWVWNQYGKTVTDKTLKAAWERLRWEDRALAYGEKVQRLYGTIQILGQHKPVSLEGIYTAVSLLDRPTALSRYTVEEMQAEFAGRGSRYSRASGKENRRDGLDMVKEGQNLFILGKPGAGKTTFLKHVALRGVKGELERVPLFIGLKQLADSGVSVFDFIISEFDVCDFPDAATYLDRLLKAGKAILLFDGLDEVNVADNERRRLITDVENFTRKYDLCPRLITCRLAAENYLFNGYTYVEMADFDEKQIGEFVSRRFKDDQKRRDLFLSELKKSDGEGLRELARVPLLLALLCLSFEETLKLSSLRVELYEEALDALLKKWDSTRNIHRDEVYRELSLKRKEQMLAEVAYEMFGRAEYFIAKKTLARSFESFLSRVPNAPSEVDGEVILRAIIDQHGLFLERAHDIYSFAHLTFQEYFAARCVVENEARQTLPWLIMHYDDPRYREVFLLTAAQLSDAGQFFDLFIERLAADAQMRPAVAALLRQTSRKAAADFEDGVARAAGRSFYISLAINLDHTHARAENLDLALDLEHILDHYLTNAFILTRALARALDFDFDFDSDRPIDLDRSSFPGPARDLALVNARQFLVNARQFKDTATVLIIDGKRISRWVVFAGPYITTAANQAKKAGEDSLASELNALAGRMKRVARDEPDDLAGITTGLEAILARCELDFPELDREDWGFLASYLEGNWLLLECLGQAAVADREAIKARLLLLPPEE